MDYVTTVLNSFRYYYNSVNPASLSGAVDIIVVEQPDGSLQSTPFHVRFGKYGVFHSTDKCVDIQINHEEVSLKMKLGDDGIAYFVEEVENGDVVPGYLATSPLPDLDRKSYFDSSESAKTRGRASTADTSTTSHFTTSSEETATQALKRESVAMDDEREKKLLPFSSSIFSCRKYRSLPDLSAWEEGGCPVSKPNPRKLTSVGTSMRAPFPKRATNTNKKSGVWMNCLDERPLENRLQDAALFMASQEDIADGATIEPSLAGSSEYATDDAFSDDEIQRHTGSEARMQLAESDTKPIRSLNQSSLNMGDKALEQGVRWRWFGWSNSLWNRRRSTTDHAEAEANLISEPFAGATKYAGCDYKAASTSYDSGIGDDCVAAWKSPKWRKSIHLSSDQLRSLDLRRGVNDARFSVTTKFQGTAWCSCHIYLWDWTDRLVISDVDGTITKSDVLGHVIPAIGGTWAHTGVVELYDKIRNNGYKLVYLSSRAIGQSHYTKNYLRKVVQGTRVLPDGPVLLSPASLYMAFRKEVIEKRPDEFKIECLSRLKSMFPSPAPFYAGFGNRETDAKAYTAVNVRKDRILLINPAGHLRSASTRGYISSYSSIAMDAVDYLFPPRRNCMLRMSSTTDSVDDECSVDDDFESPQHLSSFAYWHTSPLDFDFNLQDSIATYESRRYRLKA